MKPSSWIAVLLFVVMISLGLGINAGILAWETKKNARHSQEIIVWTWDIAAKGLEDTVESFNSKYPATNVKIVDIPWQEVSKLVVASLSKSDGNLPDVIAVGTGSILPAWFHQYPNAFVNLEPYGAGQYEGQFDPNKWDVVEEEGKILGLPWDSAPAGLFYRKDLFDEANIDVSSIRTWEDWYEAGLKLQSVTGRQTKLMTADITNGARLFTFMLQQQNISIFDEEGRVNIAHPKAINALTVLQKMVQADLLFNTPSWKSEIIDAIHQDKVASVINGVWFTGLLADQFPSQSGKWRVMLPPSFDPNQIQVGNLGGSFLLVSATSKNPEAAYAFIENAVATHQGQLTMFKNYKLLPAFLPTHNDAAFHVPVEYFGNQHIWRPFVESVANFPEVNYTEHYHSSLSLLQAAIDAVLIDGKDPETELKAVAQKIASATGREMAK
jgi:lactose/L-arabinose transport system substrate-binding protein